MANVYFQPYVITLEHLAEFFNVIIWVFSRLLQSEVPNDFLFFGRVLKHGAVERRFKTDNLDCFHFS